LLNTKAAIRSTRLTSTSCKPGFPLR